jgi:hypothetical protein
MYSPGIFPKLLPGREPAGVDFPDAFLPPSRPKRLAIVSTGFGCGLGGSFQPLGVAKSTSRSVSKTEMPGATDGLADREANGNSQGLENTRGHEIEHTSRSTLASGSSFHH